VQTIFRTLNPFDPSARKLQQPDALVQEAEEKGGVQQMLADHFATVYKTNLALGLSAAA